MRLDVFNRATNNAWAFFPICPPDSDRRGPSQRPCRAMACLSAASLLVFLSLLLSAEAGVMILPLDLGAGDSAPRRSADEGYPRRQRLLRGIHNDRKPSARMRLYDDLLTNGCSLFFCACPDPHFLSSVLR